MGKKKPKQTTRERKLRKPSEVVRTQGKQQDHLPIRGEGQEEKTEAKLRATQKT